MDTRAELAATSVPSAPAARNSAPRAAAGHPGAFLKAVESIPADAPATREVVAKPKLVPHPFYEGEVYDPNAGAEFWGKDGLGFGDILDIINPLQHVPLVSSLYRKLTGDEISPGSRLAGGALFGGPLGSAGAYAAGVVESATGQDIGQMVLAMFSGESAPETPDQATERVAAVVPAVGHETQPLIAWTTPRVLNAAADAAASVATMTPEVPASTAGATLMSPRILGNAPLAQTAATPADGQGATAALAAQLAAAGTGARVTPTGLFAEGQAAPLSFARSLLESSPAGSIPAPPPAATRDIIAADEKRKHQQVEHPDPLAAVLSARTQVPRAGAVQGLSPHRAIPEPVAGMVSGTTEAAQVARGGAPSSLFTRTTDEKPVVPGKRGVPPVRQSASALEAARRRTLSEPVPNSLVPKAMMNALEKYETMVQDRNAPAPPSGASDLTL